MKKYLVVLLVIPFMISCNKQKIKQLELKSDSLAQQAYLKDESINEFLKAFNDIQENLDSIKRKEMIITQQTELKTELQKKAKDQINEDVNTIYQLLLDTRSKLDETRKKLGKSNFKIDELEKMINHLTRQLEEKDKEIEDLTARLEQLNIEVTALTKDVGNLKKLNEEKESVIKDQEGVISEKTTALNTAFYAIGTKKELKDNNIITAEGGFIGIGKNKKLKQDFNEDFFTKIDIRQTTIIQITGKKPKIVTNHPSESYKMNLEGENPVIEIININEFWKSSKYLVIIVD